MHARTASFNIDYADPSADAATVHGYCTIIVRNRDASFRWHVLDRRASLPHQLAERSGRLRYHDVRDSSDVFSGLMHHVIGSIHRYRRLHPARFRVQTWTWNPTPENAFVIHNLIGTLEDVRARPPMYLGVRPLDAVIPFLHGLQTGVACAGYTTSSHPNSAYHAIVEARGWEFLAMPPIDQMQAHGLTDLEIVAELMEIEIATWKATYNLE